jgi:ribosomal protein S12 methylthiotransferase
MAVAEEVSAAKLQKRVGATMQILVDSAPGLGKKGGVGRSYADAPEIDGVVYLADAEGLQPGDLVEVQITDADGHDLWGAPPSGDPAG